MSDPARTHLLNALAEFGILFPDMRLGQAIANLVTSATSSTTRDEWSAAVWDIEDEDLLAEARRLIDLRNEATRGGGPLPHAVAIERPSGDGRSPQKLRRTWLDLLTIAAEFAEANPSAVLDGDDSETLAAIVARLDRSSRTPATDAPARRSTLAS